MAKRQITEKKADSAEVQGEGSWFTYKLLTVGERRKFAEEGSTQLEFHAKIVAMKVTDWNWADENDDPLPHPSEEGFENSLTDDELLFIFRTIAGSEGERKN